MIFDLLISQELMSEKNGLNWYFYPLTTEIPEFLAKTVRVFEDNFNKIDSYTQLEKFDQGHKKQMDSNDVLKILEPDLEAIGYKVERSKKNEDKIRVTVKYGSKGVEDLSFEADAYSKEQKVVVEVEAGRAWSNNQFLKDIFEASMMIDTDYLVLAVKNIYRRSANNPKSNFEDFSQINKFIETIYLTGNIQLRLKGILLIGY